jgi:tyrosine decarboxylase
MLRRHIELAHGFAEWVATDERFELAAPPSFSTVCFRALPPAHRIGSKGPAESNDWNRRLLELVNRRGRVFLSHTELSDRFVLRLAIGSAWVRAEDIAAARAELGAAYETLATSDPDPGVYDAERG